MPDNLIPGPEPLADADLYLLHGHLFRRDVFPQAVPPSGGDRTNQLVHAVHEPLGSPIALVSPKVYIGAPAI